MEKQKAAALTGGNLDLALAAPTRRLGPGFRFHPTDEELVVYYLRRKVRGKPFHVEAIAVVDIYKHEPWELHAFSAVNTTDQEWYFLVGFDKKYKGSRLINRSLTEKGYWKTSEKDQTVSHKREIVGMKKTLVYHAGRPPNGRRTNWVMHEYRLVEAELDKAGVDQITKPPFSSIVKPFVDSIFHEQDHNSQIGASLCLAAAIEATPDPDPAELRKLLPKLYKLVKNDCFKAKPSLLSLIGSIVSVGGAANRTVLNDLVSTLVDSTRAAMAMATIERTRPVPILCK